MTTFSELEGKTIASFEHDGDYYVIKTTEGEFFLIDEGYEYDVPHQYLYTKQKFLTGKMERGYKVSDSRALEMGWLTPERFKWREDEAKRKDIESRLQQTRYNATVIGLDAMKQIVAEMEK